MLVSKSWNSRATEVVKYHIFQSVDEWFSIQNLILNFIMKSKLILNLSLIDSLGIKIIMLLIDSAHNVSLHVTINKVEHNKETHDLEDLPNTSYLTKEVSYWVDLSFIHVILGV